MSISYNIVQYCKLYLNTYTTTSNISEINWQTPDTQPDFFDESLLFMEDADESLEFAGLTTYDDKKVSYKWHYHGETSTARLSLIVNGLRDMCLHFTPNDQYSEMHLDSYRIIHNKNPNFFDAEGVISAVINIVSI